MKQHNLGKLNILVDAAYAFDYYAILLVKLSKELIDSEISELFLTSLTSQLGFDLIEAIISSTEFDTLVEANKETFELVDKAKKNEVLASEVNDANFNRFLAKKALQDKFFGKPLSEVKNDER